MTSGGAGAGIRGPKGTILMVVLSDVNTCDDCYQQFFQYFLASLEHQWGQKKPTALGSVQTPAGAEVITAGRYVGMMAAQFCFSLLKQIGSFLYEIL